MESSNTNKMHPTNRKTENGKECALFNKQRNNIFGDNDRGFTIRINETVYKSSE